MNRYLEFVRNLWIRARIEAPAPVQRAIILPLHQAKTTARLLARPYLPVYQLQGQGAGGPLTIAYIGLEFAKPVLKSLLFTEKPVEQRVGRIPFWRYDELATASSSDIVIIHATQQLIRKLPRERAIVLPHYVHHVLDVRGDWESVQRRFRRTVRKNELRWIRKYGYEYDVSHDRQDFVKFFRQMYVLTMDDRHGDLSLPMSMREAYQYFRHGHLLRVRRDGDWVSGGVCHAEQGSLVFDITGVKNADKELIRQGATAATYYAAIHWANQQGHNAINFLGSGPYLNSGRFQHKRKWGASVSVPSHLHRQIWIRVRRNTPAVSQFLKETPFIVADPDGKLHGLIVVDDPHSVSAETMKEWEKQYMTPGLSSLLVRSVSYFAEESTGDDDSGLVIPIALVSSSGNGT